jgi:O-antigen/teichoic acid export membrane protein
LVGVGIVKRQSIWNAVGGYLGVVVGAVNALVLLPWAFAADPDGFGFARWILSAALLVGAFAHLGYPHALVTFAPRVAPERKADLFGAGLASAAGVLLALGALGLWKGDEWVATAVNNPSFGWGWAPLWALVASYVLFELVASQAQSAYRVVAPQWIKDVGRKLVLTVAGVFMVLHLINFEDFVWFITAGHLGLTAVLWIYARRWISIGWNWSHLPWREFLVYAGFMFLTAGAQMAMGQLDVVLIGKRLDLAQVARYSIAFQLGVVVAVPAKAMGHSLRPMIAEAWSRNDTARLLELVRRGGVHQFYSTAFLVFGLWAVLPLIEGLLPVAYQGVSELALWVGVAQLIHVSTGVSGLVLASSPRYRWDFWANFLLVLFIAVVGWWALPRYGTISMGWVLVSAAVLYNLFKAILVQKLVGAWPSGVQPLWALFYFALASFLHWGVILISLGTIGSLLLELACQTCLFLVWIAKSPELPDFQQMLNGWTRRLLPKQPKL